MATAVTDPTQIERAVEKFLTDRVDDIQASARQHDTRNLFADIVLTVAILKGRDEPIGPTKFKTTTMVTVMLSFTDAGGEEDRREGINPLVAGIRKILARQKFGLAISGLIPKGFEDVTTPELWAENKIVYGIEFETSYTWMTVDEDEEEQDLLGVGISYFLRPGDEIPDAADQVRIEEQQ